MASIIPRQHYVPGLMQGRPSPVAEHPGPLTKLLSWALVHNLRRNDEVVICPTFDHAIKDPIHDGLTVDRETQIVILEGNYLLSDEGPCKEIAELADERWLIHVEAGIAWKRVALRHLQSGIEDTLEKAFERVDGNYMVNREYLAMRSQGRYDLLIESIEEC